MKRDPIPAKVLATRLIPNVSPDMAKELGLTPDQKSLALITADCDDVTYTALDEATKKADCKVVYAKSFYAGAANANTALAGEIIRPSRGICPGPRLNGGTYERIGNDRNQGPGGRHRGGRRHGEGRQCIPPM